jgi:DNA-binding transcriptional LysR family regulator
MPTSGLRNFDLNLLKVFDVVMAERSLTRAALRLSLTQPAVSNALRRLREALGDELLVRKGRGLAPTARALSLWPAVRDILQRLQVSLAPDTFYPERASDIFVLAMADATAAEIIAPLVERIGAQAPDVSIRVLPLTTRDPRRMLDENQADLAVGHFPVVLAELLALEQAGETPGYQHHRLFGSDYVCVMRKGHPLSRQPLTLDSFCAARHMLVSFSGRALGFVDEALTAMERKRHVVLTVNQFFTAGTVVAHTDLLTVLPRHFVRVTGYEDRLCLQELPFPVAPIQVIALWHQRHEGSAAHTWLREKVNTLATEPHGA